MMKGVRVLVGTRKGAFVLTSDGKREKWDVSGPHFAGWEIYHMKGSPVDPNGIYVSQTSGWFGQIIQRSDDGGKTWDTPAGAPAKSTEGFPMGQCNQFGYDDSAESGDRALRASHRHASLQAEHALHAEALGRDAQRQRRRSLDGGQRKPAHGFWFRRRCPCARTGNDLRHSDQERRRALRSRREAA